jgi:hypothetical protein
MNSDTNTDTAHLPHFCSRTCMLEADSVGFFTGDDCDEDWVNTQTEHHDEPHCDWCGESDDDNEPYEDSAWADADALRSIGWGDDEDYGYCGGDDY